MKIQSTQSDLQKATGANQSEAPVADQTDFFSQIISLLFSQSINKTENEIPLEKMGAQAQEEQHNDKPDVMANTFLLLNHPELNQQINDYIQDASLSTNKELKEHLVTPDNPSQLVKPQDNEKVMSQTYPEIRDKNPNGNLDFPAIQPELEMPAKEIDPIVLNAVKQVISNRIQSHTKPIESNLVIDNHLDLSQTQEKQVQIQPVNSMTPTDKDSTNNFDNANKYYNAFQQLGEIINSHTSSLVIDNKPASTQDVPSYNDIFQKINRPDYEVKVETSINFSGLDKETYHANIKIHPPELGAIMAQLKVDKSGTELFIVAENNHVKDIIQNNLPQLRESFQQVDVTLTNIQVDVQNPHSSAKDQHNSNPHQQFAAESNEVDPTLNSDKLLIESKVKILNSLVDTYA